MFIDIHNHTLFGVDDGPRSLEESWEMLEDAREQGAGAIILTPHYRHGMFPYPTEQIEENFKRLCERAERLELSLYLGCEYHVNSEITDNLRKGRCRTLAGSDYVLTEYSGQTRYSYISEYTGKLLSSGYIPVIAHVERYECLLKEPALCGELSGKGALIQVNADSVLGLEGRTAGRFCRKILKNQWVDLIASDAHGRRERANHMGSCQRAVEKAYGTAYARKLFWENPRRVLENR